MTTPALPAAAQRNRFSRVRDNLHLVPEHMHDGLMLYLEHGVEPGSFLDAVLRNDLVGAFTRADELNQHAMRGWAELMYWHIPMSARGVNVDQWMADRRADAALASAEPKAAQPRSLAEHIDDVYDGTIGPKAAV